MGEIIDLDSYRRQRRRRVESRAATFRRDRNRHPAKDDRVRPAVEPSDARRGGLDRIAKSDPDDKPGD